MKLMFLGDWCHRTSKSSPQLQHPLLRGALADADAVIANFEGPLSTSGSRPIAKVGPHLAQPAEGIDHLATWGLTHASLANNHALDAGDEGLRATVEGLESCRLTPFGYRSATHGDCRVARIGDPRKGGVALIAGAEREFTATEESAASTLDPIDLHAALSSEREAGYTAILVLHGGIEYQHQPPPHLRRLARWLLDCGAAAVITHHPHVPGYVEEWNGKPIAWSLGDLWMPHSGVPSAHWRGRGYAVVYEVNDEGVVEIEQTIPYTIDYAANALRKPTEDELDEFAAMQTRQSAIGQDDEAYTAWWSELVAARQLTYLRRYTAAPVPRTLWRRWFGLGVLYRRWLALRPQWVLRQLNGLRCESHREVWTAVLESKAKKQPEGRT